MNTKPGWARLTAGITVGPVVGIRPRAGAVAPGALEDVVHHQHRHVAADAVALRGDRRQRLDRRRAQIRREGVQLHDIRPGREVRVAAVGEDGRRPHGRRRPGRARGRPRCRPRSTRDAPPSTDGRGRRDSARSRGSSASPRSASAARAAARPAGPPRCAVDPVVPDAVRRADHVLGREVGQRAAERLSTRLVVRRARSRSPPGCAPRRPSATQRRTRAAGSRPTHSPGRSRGRSTSRRGGSARRARPTC